MPAPEDAPRDVFPASRRASVPADGNALERLHQFQRERGFSLSDVANPRELRTTLASASSGVGGESAVLASSVYLAALAQKGVLQQTAPPIPIAQAWRPLGPFAIPHGATYGGGSGSQPSVAGRVTRIAVDPSNANHILVGAAGGGVWESKDTGRTWAPRTDTQPTLWVGAIAFDPSKPSVAYAGTGEGDQVSFLGAGILRSTDGGTTWALIASGPFVGNGFYRLVVDPLNSNHLLAGTTNGLFESSDGGFTWTQRRAEQTWGLSMASSVAGDAASTKEVFAACADGVFRSTNGGATWSAVALPGAPAKFWRIDVCRAPTDRNVVYVFAAGDPPVLPDPGDPTKKIPTAYLWRRTLSGATFVTETLDSTLQTRQYWYDWFAAVAPNDPNVLYLGAIDLHKGTRSSANTWTWENISARGTGKTATEFAGFSIHPDEHDIAFSPSDANVLYVGCDGGIYRSPDGGTTWQGLNTGLCITELEYLAQHPQFETWLIAGTQDNGTLRYEGDEVWHQVQSGDGGDCGVNIASPYTCYHSYFNMGLERSVTGGSFGSWTWIGPNVPKDYKTQFYPPMAVNGAVVAQAGESVFISSNAGTSFTEIKLPAGAGVASALAIPTPTRVCVGTDAGKAFRLDQVGASWSVTTLAQPRSGYLSDIRVDPNDPSRLWATYSQIGSGSVFRSDNGGAGWINVSSGLPTIAANAIAVDPANTAHVYLAMDVGVFRSTDAGLSWTSFSAMLPNALVRDLVFHGPSRLLRAATQSRGLWEIAVDTPSTPDVEVYVRDSVVDSGRRTPSPTDVPDPFVLGAKAYWWQSPDVKVDVSPWQTPTAADVDFEKFEDDHGSFFAGLTDQTVHPGKSARVFVQVHNRGPKPATNVMVKMFFTAASVGLPDLPDGFWTGFPSNTLPTDSEWQAVGPHIVIPRIDDGRPRVVAFDWSVPPDGLANPCLLAIVSAENDSISTPELTIHKLVPAQKKCAMKNVQIYSPPVASSSPVAFQPYVPRIMKVDEIVDYGLGIDGDPNLVIGVLLSQRLSDSARLDNLPQIALSAEQQAEVRQLVNRSPTLLGGIDLNATYRVQRSGILLRGLKIRGNEPELIVVLMAPDARAGQCSILQLASDGSTIGGYTVRVASNGGGTSR